MARKSRGRLIISSHYSSIIVQGVKFFAGTNLKQFAKVFAIML